jgi:hypothetical protein
MIKKLVCFCLGFLLACSLGMQPPWHQGNAKPPTQPKVIGTSSMWKWQGYGARDPYPGTIWCYTEGDDILHIYILLERDEFLSPTTHYFDENGKLYEHTRSERLQHGWQTVHLMQKEGELFTGGKVFLKGSLLPTDHMMYARTLPYLHKYNMISPTYR